MVFLFEKNLHCVWDVSQVHMIIVKNVSKAHLFSIELRTKLCLDCSVFESECSIPIPEFCLNGTMKLSNFCHIWPAYQLAIVYELYLNCVLCIML